MTEKLTRLYVRASTGDRGQGALEYIGILAVVAVVVGLAITAFQASQGNITTGLQGLIDKLLGGK